MQLEHEIYSVFAELSGEVLIDVSGESPKLLFAFAISKITLFYNCNLILINFIIIDLRIMEYYD